MNKSLLVTQPKKTALLVSLACIGLLVAALLGCGLVVNFVQRVRRDAAVGQAQQNGQILDPAELDRRFPVIEFF
ncbi:MAG: hypothetical protein U0517_03615 [Candidatus Andersenbacteria bacterium]